MPILYHNTLLGKCIKHFGEYLVHEVNETFHPVCTACFIVNRYVPLDNKYYYDRNFVALNSGYEISQFIY